MFLRVTAMLLAGFLASCDSPTSERSLPPPTLSVTTGVRVLPDPPGAPQLEVAALLRNDTRVSISVSTGPTCPLQSHLFADPSGEPMATVPIVTPCAPDSHMISLAPGDSVRLTQVWTADTLAAFAPGTYGASIVVTTSTGIIGKWAGAVTLPLVITP